MAVLPFVALPRFNTWAVSCSSSSCVLNNAFIRKGVGGRFTFANIVALVWWESQTRRHYGVRLSLHPLRRLTDFMVLLLLPRIVLLFALPLLVRHYVKQAFLSSP